MMQSITDAPILVRNSTQFETSTFLGTIVMGLGFRVWGLGLETSTFLGTIVVALASRSLLYMHVKIPVLPELDVFGAC